MIATDFFRINTTAGEEFAKCMNIYREAFPVNERQSEKIIAERIDNRRCLMIAGKKDGRVLCFAIIWEFENSPFVFLDYFAVAQQARGERVGTALLDYVIENFVTVERPMIVEVEDPDEGDNHSQRIKRIAFYKRRGALVLDHIRYFLPPLGGATEPMKMKLMMLPAPRQHYSEIVFDELVKTIYREVYDKEWLS